MTMLTLDDVRHSLQDLPSLPAVVMELLGSIDQEDVDISVLARKVSLDQALTRLSADAERPVGEALLDQRNLSGIGNMYKAEACFLVGVHPFTPVGQVDVLRQLVEKARRLLQANLNRADQTTTGDLRRGHRLWVYGRRGQPCRRCGTRIQAVDTGTNGTERVTYWCPRCQPDG